MGKSEGGGDDDAQTDAAESVDHSIVFDMIFEIGEDLFSHGLTIKLLN